MRCGCSRVAAVRTAVFCRLSRSKCCWTDVPGCLVRSVDRKVGVFTPCMMICMLVESLNSLLFQVMKAPMTGVSACNFDCLVR